ncbi:MAG TPA: radical SAM protein [Candidatus Margulisiibacteriota bacterium]|nr:radical SAM protein [Candidatus Margulisiibacteriota bacterium]
MGEKIAKGQSIYIEHMGCSRRGLDASKFDKYFTANGFLVARSPKKADYILFVTCAFRKIEEDYAIKRIRELSRYNSRLIVGGCLKGVNEARLHESFKGLSFTTFNIERVDELFPDFRVKFKEISDSDFAYPKSKFRAFVQYFYAIRLDFSYFKRLKICWERRASGRYRYLRVAWGCTGEHCAYCLIWRAVGELKSKTAEECLREFKGILGKGYKDIILAADNLGIYGLDINLTLPDLLVKLLEIDGDYNIHLDEFHPFWLIQYLDRLVPLLLRDTIKSIICPVQSANDRILKLMNRRHSKAQLAEALLKIKKINPGLKLSTTIIAGFPSESEEEFEETLNFIGEINFELVYIFGYSRNPFLKTPEIISREIPEDIIRMRTHKAIKFCKKHRIACAIA